MPGNTTQSAFQNRDSVFALRRSVLLTYAFDAFAGRRDSGIMLAATKFRCILNVAGEF
jgi:hypothetical protein